MSVVEKNSIDILGTEQSTGFIVMTISDHLDWSDELSHLNQLQDKINAYIEFYETSQLYDSFPDAKGRNIVIRIVNKYPPSDKAKEFYALVEKVLININLLLQVRQLDS